MPFGEVRAGAGSVTVLGRPPAPTHSARQRAPWEVVRAAGARPRGRREAGVPPAASRGRVYFPAGREPGSKARLPTCPHPQRASLAIGQERARRLIHSEIPRSVGSASWALGTVEKTDGELSDQQAPRRVAASASGPSRRKDAVLPVMTTRVCLPPAPPSTRRLCLLLQTERSGVLAPHFLPAGPSTPSPLSILVPF